MASKAESATDVPLKFIACRSFRHEPRHQNDEITRRGKKVIQFVRVTKCNVCGVTIRTTYSVPDFRVIKRTYDYPDNYRVKGGLPVFEARDRYVKEILG